jgi:hypothetical protein
MIPRIVTNGLCSATKYSQLVYGKELVVVF